MDPKSAPAGLHRGLKNRHIQLIALGGAIGTGLFLGLSQTVGMAGPSVILGYAIGGMIAFFIMRQLGKWSSRSPSPALSATLPTYWGSFAGFMSGWNYWVLYVLVGMAELTAVGVYIQYWWPEMPTWASAAVFFVIINLINLTQVKIYGEMEFWFSLIKVAAIVTMIGFGSWLLLSDTAGPQAGVANLWRHGGFFPNGGMGLVMAMAIIMFSFGGLELVGITAAEADDPRRSIPKATNQVIYRILLFYVGALVVLLSLYPWQNVVPGSSPFVMIFHDLDSNVVATVLNVVVLTAALSVYNSCVYCNSRMLLGLAVQGDAPKALQATNRRGVPVKALSVSAIATGFCVLINYLMPGEALMLLMSLVVSALVINWAIISVTHLKFRQAKRLAGETTFFKSLGYPVTNWICLLFLAAILVIMFMNAGTRISVVLILPWLALLYGAWRLKRARSAQR